MIYKKLDKLEIRSFYDEVHKFQIEFCDDVKSLKTFCKVLGTIEGEKSVFLPIFFIMKSLKTTEECFLVTKEDKLLGAFSIVDTVKNKQYKDTYMLEHMKVVEGITEEELLQCVLYQGFVLSFKNIEIDTELSDLYSKYGFLE